MSGINHYCFNFLVSAESCWSPGRSQKLCQREGWIVTKENRKKEQVMMANNVTPCHEFCSAHTANFGQTFFISDWVTSSDFFCCNALHCCDNMCLQLPLHCIWGGNFRFAHTCLQGLIMADCYDYTWKPLHNRVKMPKKHRNKLLQLGSKLRYVCVRSLSFSQVAIDRWWCAIGSKTEVNWEGAKHTAKRVLQAGKDIGSKHCVLANWRSQFNASRLYQGHVHKCCTKT